MSEDAEPKASANIRLYWSQSQTIPGLWSAHAGHLTAAVSPSIEYPNGWYWRVSCDGCEMGNVTVGTAVDRDDAMLAAEDAMMQSATGILAAFAEGK